MKCSCCRQEFENGDKHYSDPGRRFSGSICEDCYNEIMDDKRDKRNIEDYEDRYIYGSQKTALSEIKKLENRLKRSSSECRLCHGSGYCNSCHGTGQSKKASGSTIKSKYVKTYGEGGFLGAVDIMQQIMKAPHSGLPSEWEEVTSFKAYMNGREHGFTVIAGDTYIKVSENRNSDHWVVYEDHYENLRGQYETYAAPSEAGWDSKKYFSYDEKEKVVKYVLALMKKGYKDYFKKDKKDKKEKA